MRPGDRKPPVRALYIHPFGAYGGATKSLVEMFSALPGGAVEGVALAPRGVASRSLEAAGMRVVDAAGLSKWDDTRFGHYRGVRWAILLRELAYWPATLRALRTAARHGPYDLIHCNELPALFPALIAKRWFQAPLLVHVRSLQRGAAGGRITRWILSLVRRHADAVVAIDEAVRRTLPADLEVTVVHNGLAATTASGERPLPSPPLRVGIIGVLHRAKGLYEFVEAARLLRDRGVRVHFVIVGENVHRIAGLRGWLLKRFNFAADVRADLEAFVAQHSLDDRVEFTGFVRDIKSIYERLDVVCFPSHLDAPGRPVIEAALFGLPTIVAMREPTDDVVVDGVTGLCIEAPTPMAIANAIARLSADPDACRQMGRQARDHAATRFDSRHVARQMLDIYLRLTRQHPAVAPRTSAADG
jgi:glycosyltransferase involved in cell wall biosynthesis